MDELSKKAREVKNEYQRQWKKRNSDKVKQYNIKYWERKAVENGLSVIDSVTAPVTDHVTVTAPDPIKGNICLVCGISFIGKRVDSKYCSDACKMKHHRGIKRNKVG